MNSFDIRQKFFDFFKKHDHTIIPSSSLIPAEDPTLLFANAGMNQFKDVFLGKEKRSYTRAVSSQKCVRAGGKHNDLDEVGFSNRHLTFFEMLGSFSFGDYFKKEAIPFAWEFLTKDMGLDPKQLVVSVYKTDDESYDIWQKDIGIAQDKIFRLGEKDNFWQMGDTGPCGPCTEIHMDYGKEVGCKTKYCDPSCSCGRYVEIWNLVFMQYNRSSDGTLTPLKQTGVDTGVGLERLTMVVQKKDLIFRTDLFDYLIKYVEKITGVAYVSSKPEKQSAFHVLVDHVRSAAILIADGCSPSNDGRGYVLRKIIRRAALFARKLTDDATLFPKLSQCFIETMFPVFENLKTNKSLIIKVLESEIDRFATSLDQGQQVFSKYVALNKKLKLKIISGEQIFTLYDTYGFPPELTRVMAHEEDFDVDMPGFEKEMKKQREQSGKKKNGVQTELKISEKVTTKFVGYDVLESKSKITFVQPEDGAIWIVTEESPFYVESGGQIGDDGWVTINDHSYSVKQLQKVGGGDCPAIALLLSIDEKGKEKDIKIGSIAHCVVDYYKRANAAKNHTATHLLQEALVKVLGKHVKQAGSLVNDEYLRFDFSCHEAMTKEQIEQVEQIVNQKIQENIELNIFHTTLKEAKASGVTAFFGEKYNPEKVRVVQIPGFSAELCGGTHVKSTGEIGCCKVTSEMALATGTRRIIGVAGQRAVELFQAMFATIKSLSEQYKVKPEQVLEVIQKQQDVHVQSLREIRQLRKQLLYTQIPVWQKQVSADSKVPFLFLSLKDYGNDELKVICQEIEKQTPGFYFLISTNKDRMSFVGYVSKKFTKVVDLKVLNSLIAKECGLRGGGKPDFIQGGGDGKLDVIKKVIQDWVEKQQ